MSPLQDTHFVQEYGDPRLTDFHSSFKRNFGISTLSFWDKITGKLSGGLKKNRVHFIYFHHVFEDEESSFRKILSHLALDHQFVSYSEAVSRITEGKIDNRYISVSFDDGFKNGLRAGKIMAELGISGCFFVCPSMVGEVRYEKIKEFCLKNLSTSSLSMPPVEFLSWEDLETLLKQRHEIGSHTLNHLNLSGLSKEELQNEIGKSFEILSKRFGSVRHFAWPFGRFSDFSSLAAQLVFSTGFQSCASAERGCHLLPVKERSRLFIRREHFVAGWPFNHLLYFLAKSSRTADTPVIGF